MAKKANSQASQSEQQQSTDDATVVKTEELPQEEDEQLEENNEINDEELEPEEENDDEGEEEEPEEDEENNDVAAGNDVKEVKVETNGEETEVLTEEQVEDLLNPFSKEQLVILMKEAVSKYPDLISSVEKIADADPAHRRIFVHGLGWDTTTETLISEYTKYGEIEDCKAVVDKVSGKSKGYGFILFKHRAGARKALKEPQKKIGNRITSCQLAAAGPIPAPPPSGPASGPQVSEYTRRKIYVSNVAAEIDPNKLTEFFATFGEIEEGPLGLDKQTGKPKGFVLFVYKSIESAKKALEEPKKLFEGHILNVQRAIDGPRPVKSGFHHQQQQHHHPQYAQFGGGHHYPSKKAKYSAGQGHLMAPAGPAVGFNPVIPPPVLSPVLGQALTAILAGQGGLGIGNLFGGLGSPGNLHGMPGYQQGGNLNPQTGQRGASQQPGGSSSHMGQRH